MRPNLSSTNKDLPAFLWLSCPKLPNSSLRFGKILQSGSLPAVKDGKDIEPHRMSEDRLISFEMVYVIFFHVPSWPLRRRPILNIYTYINHLI